DLKLACLRKNIGVVFQEALLFNRSIAENLRVGKPDASDDELRAACARAQALDFVERQGLEAPVGERGRLISGGERQRLAIARAVRMTEEENGQTRQFLLTCFWEAALGFWRRGAGPMAWILTVAIVIVAVVNVGVQYEITVWYRTMFDALERRDASGLLWKSMLFLPLTVANVGLAVAALHGRMTMQRRWRAWMNGHLLDRWLSAGRYYQLN